MKKSKAASRTATSKRPLPGESFRRTPMALEEIRRQITDLVGNGAIGMVETTIEEVGKGHYLGMKYLFEMIGLYPAATLDDSTMQDSMAAILLRRLGLPETPVPEQTVTKDSAPAGAATEDGLE